MSRKLGKKHPRNRYEDAKAYEHKLRTEKAQLANCRLGQLYSVRILNDNCFLRDRLMCQEQDMFDPLRLTRAKRERYLKGERYWLNAGSGKFIRSGYEKNWAKNKRKEMANEQ
ncbi:hypothetical protein [Pseudomonas phage PA1C]|uniref:Uncharacterized protein n=1 Tax=Pseudomonas phage vB_PaeM_PS119XW TaxID=2601632 RepID=A0A5C1K7K3_9CAUD|nr:hypothetical protein PP933_gp131 [Pseudomonas phage vB_PaeM_PS119XW]QBX32286.1 hypothetical protein [Pseudomonas phage PA1C]QEM41860.1 hypothetical protein [Pseudomonas phage vB_PaeM_PS119XW]